MLTFEEALFVVTRGHYSYPASKRYVNDCLVQCDFCDKKNLPASIGFQQHDVCLSCADWLKKTYKIVEKLYPRGGLSVPLKPPAFPSLG